MEGGCFNSKCVLVKYYESSSKLEPRDVVHEFDWRCRTAIVFGPSLFIYHKTNHHDDSSTTSSKQYVTRSYKTQLPIEAVSSNISTFLSSHCSDTKGVATQMDETYVLPMASQID